MVTFRCKMCGGDLEAMEGVSSCTCDFCGTRQTIPTVQDKDLQNLFNRANVLRMKAEFDKAAEVYEKILECKDTEAEAYWGLILCKYGIEYVEDPETSKRVPTCHRVSYDAVVSDEDYLNAIHYADVVQRGIYEQQAREIDMIQRDIISLARKEDPYDVFICYKEDDESGRRTQDSVIAGDIYDHLANEGYKTFYAAITLENKLGREYEPCIFSALTTARVMLVLGTRPAYFKAVWVRNEWSRFMKIMKMDRSRRLIPCYRDMDPYELPEEFSHLQAQDMGEIGFINDIVKVIRKTIVKGAGNDITKKLYKTQVDKTFENLQNSDKNELISRGNSALRDHDWSKADSCFEEALDLDTECSEAYIGKLLLKDKSPDFDSWIAMQKEKYAEVYTGYAEACPEDIAHISMSLEKYTIPGYLDENMIKKKYEYDRSYEAVLPCRIMQEAEQLKELTAEWRLKRAKQYAGEEEHKKIEDGIASIKVLLVQRIVQAQKQDNEKSAQVKAAYEAYLVETDQEVEYMYNTARSRRDLDYQRAKTLIKNADTISDYEKAEDILKEMHGYINCNNLAEKCQKEIEWMQEEEIEQGGSIKDRVRSLFQR